jgi:SagB-type dehydrogenase family enzyme
MLGSLMDFSLGHIAAIKRTCRVVTAEGVINSPRPTLKSGMQTLFDSPSPRDHFEQYTEMSWPRGKRTQLAAFEGDLTVDLAAALSTRQTHRNFSAAIPLDELGHLLWLACRTFTSRPSGMGFDLENRPHPSGGGIHPIHLVLQRSGGGALERYNTRDHSLEELPGSELLASQLREAADKALASQAATLIALVAEPGKTAAKYTRAASLVMRDAGVILGYLSLCSEVLGLSFCPLGMTGDEYLQKLDKQGKLRGVGLALLGARST